MTEEQITEAAERLFTTRFLLGLFDETEYDQIGYDQIESKEHLALADKATAEGVVLLKNDGVLPLKKNNLKTIGVIGPNANSRDALVGNYHGTSSRYITVLEGIQDFVGDSARVYYSQGCHLYKEKVENLAYRQDRISEAVAVAKNSDVVILCLGLDETMEGEQRDTGNSSASGDKIDLALPQVQRELLEKVVAVGKPVILVNMTGSAMDLRYAQDNVSAILQVWYPGARGGAVIAKLLFGEIAPSGKLPITFYNDASELPDFEDYSMKGRTYRYFEGKPLYPFGYGLTYGDIILTEVCCEGEMIENDICVTLPSDKDFVLQVRVKNKSDREQQEVLQVYIKAVDSEFVAPGGKLCGFTRVELQAQEEQDVSLLVDKKAFTVVSEEGEQMIDGKKFVVSVGFGQPDERTKELTGKKPIKFTIIRSC